MPSLSDVLNLQSFGRTKRNSIFGKQRKSSIVDSIRSLTQPDSSMPDNVFRSLKDVVEDTVVRIRKVQPLTDIDEDIGKDGKEAKSAGRKRKVSISFPTAEMLGKVAEKEEIFDMAGTDTTDTFFFFFFHLLFAGKTPIEWWVQNMPRKIFRRTLGKRNITTESRYKTRVP